MGLTNPLPQGEELIAGGAIRVFGATGSRLPSVEQGNSEARYERQDELFAHRWDLGVPRPIADRVWRLLETNL